MVVSDFLWNSYRGVNHWEKKLTTLKKVKQSRTLFRVIFPSTRALRALLSISHKYFARVGGILLLRPSGVWNLHGSPETFSTNMAAIACVQNLRNVNKLLPCFRVSIQYIFQFFYDLNFCFSPKFSYLIDRQVYLDLQTGVDFFRTEFWIESSKGSPIQNSRHLVDYKYFLHDLYKSILQVYIIKVAKLSPSSKAVV